MYIKNCVVGDSVDVIKCAKFQNETFRGYDFTGVEVSVFLFVGWLVGEIERLIKIIMLAPTTGEDNYRTEISNKNYYNKTPEKMLTNLIKQYR